MNRRAFLLGVTSLVTMPATVRAASTAVDPALANAALAWEARYSYQTIGLRFAITDDIGGPPMVLNEASVEWALNEISKFRALRRSFEQTIEYDAVKALSGGSDADIPVIEKAAGE